MQWLKKILYFAFIALVITASGAAFLFFKKNSTPLAAIIKNTTQLITAPNPAAEIDPAPNYLKLELINPREITFTWHYAGRKYQITQTFYGSFYDAYKTAPKQYVYEGALTTGWEEEYFGMFLKEKADDRTLAEVAEKIRAAGEKNKLTENQLVELTVAFAQAIEYDKAKAALINAKSENSEAQMRYPYEVLYDQKGVCSGKSLLLYALLRQLGYGAALFVYDAENHMSVGIRCTDNLSTYDSGYCYTETTAAGMNIGVIPALDQANNQAQVVKKINYYQDNSSLFDEKRLGTAQILQKTDGKIYAGISGTIAAAKEADTLKKEINNLSRELAASSQRIKTYEEKLNSLKKKMNKLEDAEDYDEYNALVNDYNDLLKTYKKEVKKYNDDVEKSNAKVNRYNSLIKSLT